MRKTFNTTGSCNPTRHYMVDTAERFRYVENLIDGGNYFTINRARQFGKTTLLKMINRRLSDKYIITQISFEGLGDSAFASEKTFSKMFLKKMADGLSDFHDDHVMSYLKGGAPESLDDLSDEITRFTSSCSRPVIMTIDEVDKSLDNQLFLNFLGVLRNKYLDRDDKGFDSTFYSVILAGVYDVKNLKLKRRPEAEKKYNPPWNIAADFLVDMTFHPNEIAQMLSDYERDVQTGMDIDLMSGEIYKYTSGYPFLVSYICKFIDEQRERKWTVGNVVEAVKFLVKGGSTLMDDLSKNLENNPDFKSFMYSISINSVSYSFSLLNPMVNMGNMFSYIKEKDGKVFIHNLVFEEALFMYFTLDYSIRNSNMLSPFQLNYVVGGRLNMEYVITRFSELIYQEYRKNDEAFLEREGRLVFLSFLKPIVNGTGFYYVEPQTRDNRRMDLVITYGKEEFIVELKIWHGEKYEQDGKEQLAGYLSLHGQEKGYLVTFDFSKNKHGYQEPSWIETGGVKIFEAII